jgi:hypothetical protein
MPRWRTSCSLGSFKKPTVIVINSFGPQDQRISSPDAYCDGPACRTKLYVRRFQAAYGQRMRFLQDRSVKLQFLAFMRRMLDRWGSLCFLGLL